MASTIILSDNGVSSGSAGLKEQGGNDGVLILQTTTAGGTATNAVTVDNLQNVGVGITPSAWGSNVALQLTGPSLWGSSGVSHLTTNTYFDGTNYKYIASNYVTDYYQLNGTHVWRYAASGTAGANVTLSEAMRIDSNGNFLVGTTTVGGKFSVVASGDTSYFQTTGTTSTCSYWKIGSNTGCYYALFQNVAGSNIGWIRTTDGSTVQYYTGSDVRLKKNITFATSALNKVSSLQVRSYDWEATNVHVDYGFIAQELAEIAPDAVSVGKDKEDGSIDVPWGVDYAKLVPLLTAAIQEQQAIIEQLRADVETLKAKP